MSKNRHGDVMLTVWNLWGISRHRWTRWQVRAGRHIFMSIAPNPKARPARSVMTNISVIAPVPFASDRCVRLSGQWLTCQSGRVTFTFIVLREAHRTMYGRASYTGTNEVTTPGPMKDNNVSFLQVITWATKKLENYNRALYLLSIRLLTRVPSWTYSNVIETCRMHN
jgi:hypothetical protein